MNEEVYKEFNHLKIHTQYSICEGALRTADLAKYCKEQKIKAAGLSDSKNLCGALEFSELLAKSKTQPIIGTQINIKYKDSKEYQDYLGLDQFEDYIHIPQKFACDDIDATEKMVAEQLDKSSAQIFLVGIGHVKSGLLHRLKKYRNAVFLDVGTGIDALGGLIDHHRPYMGDWTNYRVNSFDYDKLDILQYDIWNTPHTMIEEEQLNA